VNDLQSTPKREFRLKSTNRLLGLFYSFSATEKVVFLFLVTFALLSALLMAYKVNQYFLITVPATGGTLTEGEIGVPRTANPVLAFTDADKDVTALVLFRPHATRQNRKSGAELGGKLYPIARRLDL